jgi:hypothetical protein
MTTLLDAALEYAANGWHVFPLKEADKRPATARGFQDATTDPDQVRAWWGRNPRYNIGIATGADSGFVVLDTDNPDAEEYATMQGDTPTRCQTTAKGRHRLYKHPGTDTRNTTALHGVAGLDVRGDGGYIVAAPSVHPTGVVYAWENDNDLAPLPEWITRRPEPEHTSVGNGTGSGADRYAATALNNELAELARCQNGTRNDTLFRVCRRVNEFVLAGRLPESVFVEIETVAQRTGLPEKEITATIASARSGGTPETNGIPTDPRQRNGSAPEQARGDQAASDTDGPTIIDITAKNLGRATEQIWSAMQESEYAPALYCYGSEAAYLDDRLYVLDRVRWRGLVNRVASFLETKTTQKGGTKTEEVLPPLAMMLDSLLFLPDWLPIIDRVSPLPVFDQAGQLLTSGYHTGPRVLVQSDIAPIPMDAGAALDLIDTVFCDFPFATQADKANALAYLLAPFIREMCGPMPLFLLDAAQRGTGKTLLNDLIHTIWTGEPAPVSDLPLNFEEQRKQITTHLMSAPLSVVFDDITILKGSAIQRAVTGHTWVDRLLGKNEEVTVPIRTVWSATGNNVTLGGDMVRRVLLIRLESHEENPSQRTEFKRSENELRAFVREHRADLVSACIALVQHGLAHGTPQAIKMGGFDQFASVMSRVLHGIGTPGFYDNMAATFEREDSRQTGWKAIVWAWYETHGADMVRAGDIAKLIEDDPESEINLEGDTTKARDTAAGKLLKQRVGSVFAFPGTRLQIQKTHTNKGKARYRLKELDVSPEPTTPRGGGGGDIPHQEASAPHSPHSPHRDLPATTHARARAQEETRPDYVGYVGYVGEAHQEAENAPPARNLMARAMAADTEPGEKPTQPTHTYTPDQAAQASGAAAPPAPAHELPEGWQLVRCDHRGNVTRFGAHWRAVHADGTMTEPTQYADSAARQAWAAQAREREGGAT